MSSSSKIGQLKVRESKAKTVNGDIKIYYYARGRVTYNNEKQKIYQILKGINNRPQAEIEAQNIEIEWLRKLKDRYLKKNPEFMTFAKMTDELLDDHLSSPNRHSTYHKNKEILGNKLLVEIKQKDIYEVAFKRYPHLLKYKGIKLSRIHNLKERQQVSSWNNTANCNVIIPIGNILHYAHQQGCCPYIKVKYFQILNRKNMYRPKYSVEEIKRCIKHNDFEIVLLFVFLLFTGMRVSEALRINWEDLDNEDRKVMDLDNHILRIIPSKNGTWIKKPIHPILLEWLHKVENKTGFLFEWRNQQDGKNTPEGLIPRWNKMQEFAGIASDNKRKKRHALRHTITSMLSDNGASTGELMDFNGWNDERSALGYQETGLERKKTLINSIL